MVGFWAPHPRLPNVATPLLDAKPCNLPIIKVWFFIERIEGLWSIEVRSLLLREWKWKVNNTCVVILNCRFNPFSTRPHQNAFWYNYSWLDLLNYVPKEREKKFCKKWALIFQLNVAMAHRNYFRQNNLWILKLATYTNIEDHYSRCKLAAF